MIYDYTMADTKIIDYLGELRGSISNQITKGGDAYVSCRVQGVEMPKHQPEFRE